MVMVSNAPDPGCGNQKPKNTLRIFDMNTESPEIMMIAAYEAAESSTMGMRAGQRTVKGIVTIVVTVMTARGGGGGILGTRHCPLTVTPECAQPSSESNSR